MSPTRACSAANDGRPALPPKRASSFAGLLSKILPSHRPEQGGTRRPKDATGDTDSAYHDLKINPNELRDWNVARDRPARVVAAAAAAEESSPRRGHSWSPRKGDSKFVEDLAPNTAQRLAPNVPDRHPPPRPVTAPSTSLLKSDSMTQAEISELLKAKEKSRRQRRSLKASGDWLGPQGADPYTGEFPVLSPTDTLSSDTTTLSTRDRLAGLMRQKEEAKLAYQQVKLLEEEEKERAKREKEHAKLNKIERAKDELRREQSLVKWSQHKRHWSSAAEPNLSPIAQSMDSLALGNGPEEITVIPNYSRPSPSPAGARTVVTGPLEPLSSENKQLRKHEHRFDPSTDTIIHNTSVNLPPPRLPFTAPAVPPPTLPLDNEQSDLVRSKSEKHFLWRRRRRTIGPGELVREPAAGAGISTSVTEGRLVSSSLVHLPTTTNHFADLAIPDHRLHLMSPDPVGKHDNPSSPSVGYPSISPTRKRQGVLDGTQILTPTTDTQSHRAESHLPSQGTSVATVTSSQSKLKGLMKPPSIPRKLAPSRLVSAPANETHKLLTSIHDSLNRTDKDPSGETLGSQSEHLPVDIQGRISPEWAGNVLHHMDSRIELVKRESASIHTTITTGSDPAQPSQHDDTPSQLQVPNGQPDSVADTNGGLVTPTSPKGQPPHCVESTPATYERTIPSRPTTPPNGSQRLVHAQKTAETDTVSDRPVTPDQDRTPKAHHPSTPGSCRTPRQTVHEKSRDSLEEAGQGTVTPPPRYVDFTEGSAPAVRTPEKEPKYKSTSPIRNLQGKFRRARPRQSPYEHTEAMVQDAARIAMQRSRAKEVMNRSPIRASRLPGPIDKPPPLPQKKEKKGQQHPDHDGSANAGTGVLSRLKSFGRGQQQRGKEKDTQSQNQNQNQNQNQKKQSDDAKQKTKTNGVSSEKRKPPADGADANAFMVMGHGFIMVYMVLLGLACAWWTVARPAFDQTSDLWKRRRGQRSSWEDVSVFAAAAALCAVGAVATWFVLTGVGWVLGV
ncbi:Uu.00g017460.m01.CDS01 [Anthostomella pinea]|uniref:Uu.00g017460.m01.CDS01 n=1 Tax=Anthostomella pinea TaxID=933095 RepID=A0AAI8VYX7_9PEZI|nr:Uu.00g017460.m01.CDS01 [Anthostomella pinea]